MTKRRPDRIIEFTEENIANAPLSRAHMDFFYDRDMPYFAFRKVKNDPVPDFVVLLTHGQTAALKAAGSPPNRYIRLGRIPLAEARTKAMKEWVDIQELAAKRERGRRPIPEDNANKPAATIFEDRVEVESPNYDALQEVLMDAYAQAAEGKGKDRHGFGLNFEDQDMLAVTDQFGLGFPLGQAAKKLSEGKRMDRASARKEFLGAICYIAGAIVWLDRLKK